MRSSRTRVPRERIVKKETIANALRRLGPMVNDLYDEVDVTTKVPLDASKLDDQCPLYTAISSINDRYQTPELIGRGGMKEVYRVFDARASRHVALAKPLAQHSFDHFDAFLREAHLTARLEHPCIIDLFDMDVDKEGRPFFTMEFKRGRTLREVLRQLRDETEQLTLRERLAICLRVCEAIAYAHSRRVLHLDIKPENIQVGEFGETQVCDWGMGVVMPHYEEQHDSEALLDPDLYGSLLDAVKGTPLYMAPEQKDRKTAKTAQMDIYAIGCVLFELVTLQSYSKEHRDAMQDDAVLIAIISKATADDPADRYASVSSLREDIKRYLEGYSTSVEQSSFVRESVLFYRRHRDICAVVFGAILIVTLSLAIFAIGLRRSQGAALAARDDAVQARLEAEQDRARMQIARYAAEDAQTEAELAQGNAEEALARYLSEKQRSEERLVRQVVSAVSSVDDVTSLPLMYLHDNRQLALSVELAMKQLDDVLANNPPRDSEVWMQKLWMCFLVQDFATALELIESNKVVDDDLVKLAPIYRKRQTGNDFLQTDDLIALVKDLCKSKFSRAPLAEKLIVFDAEHPRPEADRSRIVQEWVSINNPNWTSPELTFNSTNRSVRLRGQGLTTLSRTLVRDWPPGVKVNLLYSLSPKKIDIRGTDFQDLQEIRGLTTHEIDISNTKVNDLSPLVENKHLRRIVISKGQFPQSQIAMVPKSISIRFVD